MRFAMPLLVAFALNSVGCLHAVEDGPIVVVTASHPEANAQMVADLVAAPIEQQINGTEGMVRLESESRNDGTYVAYVRFDRKTDPTIAVTLVRNRVALAKAALPEAVQGPRVALKVRARKERDKNRVTIALVDRGGHEWKTLCAFSEAVLKRLSADGTILNPETFPGPDEKQVRVKLDAAKCCEHGVSVADVQKVLRKAMNSAILGTNIEALKALPITSTQGDKILLGSLASVEVVKGPPGVCRVDMCPAVRITGAPPEGKTTKSATSRCAELADAERKSRKDSDGFAVLKLTAR